jgi:hypothetical protein
MTRQHADSLALEGIPNVAVEVVVASKEDATRDGEADRGDAAEDVVVGVLIQLAVRAEVEEAARGVVRAGCEGVAVREESVEAKGG